MIRRLIYIAFTVFLSAIPIAADDEVGSLSGRILPAQGENTLPAVITVRLTGSLFQGTKYAMSGQFSFDQIPPGNYTLAVTADGREDSITQLVGWSAARSDTSVIIVLGAPVREQLPPSNGSVVSLNALRIPEKAGSELAKASKYQEKSDFAKAEEHLKAAIRIYPQFAEAFNNLGVLYIKQNRPKDAEQAFLKATELAPDNITPLKNLAFAKMRVGNYQEAVAPLVSATNLDSADAKAQASLGECYLRLKDLPRAREHFEKSVVLDPKLPFSRHRLGYICLEQGDHANALKHLRAFLDLKIEAGRPQVEALVGRLEKQIRDSQQRADADGSSIAPQESGPVPASSPAE